jgi:hypothetical protein
VSTRVELERSGGFAGITLRSAVDTTELPPDQAAELERLVAAANLPALAAQSGPPVAAPDRFQYSITMAQDGTTHQLVIGESQITPKLRPLIEHMESLARS